MNDFYKLSLEQFEMMRVTRRCLHQNPEIDRNLPQTVATVCKVLDKLGIEYKLFPNSGIIAELGKCDADHIVALRADMDALEIQDDKSVEYKSQIAGAMHACGHDAHTAILLGAAAILKSIENQLAGKVRLIFQPAEETDGGAKEMIEYGALEGVEAIFGLHVDETLKTGVIGVNHGTVHAASNPFRIQVSGKGAHGASPEAGVDSIYVASKILDGLQGIVSREVAATDSAVITVGKISGGTAANAICNNVVLEGILRTLGKELRSFAKQRIQSMVELTAQTYRAQAEVTFVEGYPSFGNNRNLVLWFRTLSIDNKLEVKDLDKPSMGVEDFAYYAEIVPALFYRLGCKNEEMGIVHPAHGGFFDVDEDCLVYGAMMQSQIAFTYLQRNEYQMGAI